MQTNPMYLTEDIIGAASRRLYGKKGEQVQVLNDTRDLILVQGASERFHVHPYQLSEKKVEKETTITEKKINNNGDIIKKTPKRSVQNTKRKRR